MRKQSVFLTLLVASISFSGPSVATVAPRHPAPHEMLQRIDHRFECGQVKDPDLAIEGCKALIAADPEDGTAYLALGLAYERIGDGSAALDAFISATSVGHRLTEANADNGEAWYLIARASQGAARVCGDAPDMRKDFEDAAREASAQAAARGIKVPDPE